MANFEVNHVVPSTSRNLIDYECLVRETFTQSNVRHCLHSPLLFSLKLPDRDRQIAIIQRF